MVHHTHTREGKRVREREGKGEGQGALTVHVYTAACARAGQVEEDGEWGGGSRWVGGGDNGSRMPQLML